MTINLVTEFLPYVDEINKAESKRALLTNNDFNWSGAHTVKVYKVGTTSMNDYDRAGTGENASRYGAVAGLDATTEEMTLRKDRSFTFAIDALDEDETAQQLAGASALARQQREVIIPEVDAYVYDQIASHAGTKHTTEWPTTVPNVYGNIIRATEIMDQAEVPELGRIIVMTPLGYRLLKQDATITLNISISDELRKKGVVAELDGMNIVKVPSNRLPAGTIFMIVHPNAAVAPIKLEEYKVHDNPPGISGTLVEGRICYDCFVLDNQTMCIYHCMTYAPKLTVASAEGTASGKTAITVTEALESGHSYKYKTGASVTMPVLGASCGTGWTAWDGDDEITATTGNTLIIAEVDSDNKCVKAGSATVTAKA